MSLIAFVFPSISEYAKTTWKYLESLWNSPLGGKIGISLVPCIQTNDKFTDIPAASTVVYGFQIINPTELASFNKPEWK